MSFSPQPAVIKWNTRIVRATEMFLFCARLYDNLGVERTDQVNIRIGFGGLNGRTLAVAGQRRTMIQQPKTTSEKISKDLVVSLAEIESNIVGLVKQACEPLFMQFNFYKVEDTVYEQIVNDYVAGKAT